MTFRIRRVAALVLASALLSLMVMPAVVLAAGPSFGPPSVTAKLGETLTFTSTIDGGDIASVDVVIHLDGNPTSVVVASTVQINNIFQAQADINVSASALCACLAQGNSTPNTHFNFQFRVTDSSGAETFGPVAEATVEDTRFTWQTLTKGDVVIHWYNGDQAFADSAADSANAAIVKAAGAFGVTVAKPFDMFVYDTQEAMRSAVSPNRENIQAEAHPDIDTIFAWLPSNQPADPDNEVTIAHELTHLVFHHAVDNPYHGVPRWLDEGIATYESEGYTSYWQNIVNDAVAGHSLIPLDGIAGLFPSVKEGFYLAYGESVAAVDYFIRTYGEQKLSELVASYGQGVSDDDAFTAATGSTVDAFNDAWFASMNQAPPDAVGPQPGAPGPLPADWTSDGGAPATLSPTLAPGATPTPPSVTARPQASPGASAAPNVNGNSRDTDITSILLVLGVVVALVVATLAVGIALRSRTR
jgi:hypothetical protein